MKGHLLDAVMERLSRRGGGGAGRRLCQTDVHRTAKDSLDGAWWRSPCMHEHVHGKCVFMTEPMHAWVRAWCMCAHEKPMHA
eukprot:363828-Chlamydomonas_euryale.AAC.10